jgi:integration host factor subunit beta
MAWLVLTLEGGAMKKSDLINALSKSTGLTKKKAEKVVNTVFDEMSNALMNCDRVEIRGFCSMFVKQYDESTATNPKTGEVIKVKPKKLPFFKFGKGLKERIYYW